ncbi:hypothetical protein ACFQL4_06470 [Halosimplex aquaticum]
MGPVVGPLAAAAAGNSVIACQDHSCIPVEVLSWYTRSWTMSATTNLFGPTLSTSWIFSLYSAGATML